MINHAVQTAPQLSSAAYQVMFQHDTADGYITLARKDYKSGAFKQRHYKPQQLVNELSHAMGENIYYSQNTFYKPSRKVENIRQLRSLYVDVDFYTMDIDKDWVLAKLEHDFYKKSIPEPNFIIFSGQGIVLIWLIEPVPYKALPLWQAVQNYLTKELRSIGADEKCTDAARVFRLAGSINSKNGQTVHVEYRHDYKYELREIQADYLPDLTPKVTPQKTKKKANNRKKVVRLFNVYSLHHARLLDVTKLAELRNYNVEGYRELLCFLYRYYSCCFTSDPEEALRQTVEFNNMFTSPLPHNEVVKATKSAETAWAARSNEEANKIAKEKGYPGAGYNISNAKLIKWLDITPEEEKEMCTIIGGKEKKRRKAIYMRQYMANKRRESGVKSRSEYLQGKINKRDIVQAAMATNPGASIRELVNITGMAKSTVQRLRAEIQAM